MTLRAASGRLSSGRTPRARGPPAARCRARSSCGEVDASLDGAASASAAASGGSGAAAPRFGVSSPPVAAQEGVRRLEPALVDLFGQSGEGLADGRTARSSFDRDDGRKAVVAVENLAQGLELVLRAGVELHLQLVEAVERLTVDQDLDRVDAEVDRRFAGREAADPPHLADGEHVTRGASPHSSMTTERAGEAGQSAGGASSCRRALELLAAVQPAFRGGQALEADRGFARSGAAGRRSRPVARAQSAEST
jgi:hypothetical protein